MDKYNVAEDTEITDESQSSAKKVKVNDILNIYEDIVVYDYAYKGFHKLRYEDGITIKMIKESLDPEANLENARKAGESTGKSGSFFFFTKDKKFIVKTMFQEELDIYML